MEIHFNIAFSCLSGVFQPSYFQTNYLELQYIERKLNNPVELKATEGFQKVYCLLYHKGKNLTHCCWQAKWEKVKTKTTIVDISRREEVVIREEWRLQLLSSLSENARCMAAHKGLFILLPSCVLTCTKVPFTPVWLWSATWTRLRPMIMDHCCLHKIQVQLLRVLHCSLWHLSRMKVTPK